MTLQAPFSLQGHNPDVLTCIANLSNDEIFTPPELANEMLDTLEQAWAESNDGASIWADSTATFLDPFTKSGVFLREITRRLTEGLASEIPNLEDRVDHILTKQIFGIGITRLTALLARRSVYCSKDATGEHSIAKSFDRDWGNIWFERTEHSWVRRKKTRQANPLTGDEEIVGQIGTGRCEFCGAQEQRFERDEFLETHAYAFIHTHNVKARVKELFGADMQFDVIIGNPPYQMTGASGGSSDAAIYQLFVEQAQRMQPTLLSMVIPARWMAGGRGLDGFRAAMLGDGHVVKLVDYPIATDIFPANGADFEGGACYFLWSESFDGRCTVRTVRDGVAVEEERVLDEFDIFVREPRAVRILQKVLALNEDSMASIMTNTEPFKFETNFSGFHHEQHENDVPIYYFRGGKRQIAYLERDKVQKNVSLIDRWKVLAPRGYGERGTVPAQVLGRPWVAPEPSICTGTFQFFWADSESQADSMRSYYETKFFRFLVSLRKITQHAFRSTYTWVPMQSWDREWIDDTLYRKYGIDRDEQQYIESQIKTMSSDV